MFRVTSPALAAPSVAVDLGLLPAAAFAAHPTAAAVADASAGILNKSI